MTDAASPAPANAAPRVWLLLSEKPGDNAQVQAVADALPWPHEIREIRMQERFVLGKPKITPSLDHVDRARSDRLEAPWPDLIITSGRRMSMVALWIQEQSQGRTRLVLIGMPKRFADRFSLAVVAEQYRETAHANFLRISYPLQRVDETAIAAAAAGWRADFAPLKRPLIAVMVGGRTSAVRFDAATAKRLARDLAMLAAKENSALIVTTSRRTPPEVVTELQRGLPAGTVFHLWTPEGGRNPYQALLTLADRFVVTSDSLSMLMEIARLGRPLAIYALPLSTWLGDSRLGRGLTSSPLGGVVQRLGSLAGKIVAPVGWLSHQRDLTALHRLLVKDGLAVWFGEKFKTDGRRPVDELPRVVDRIVGIMNNA